MRIVTILAVAALSLGVLAGCAAEPLPSPASSSTSTPTPSSTPRSTPSSTPTPVAEEPEQAPIDPGPNQTYPNKPADTALSCGEAVAAAAAVPPADLNNDQVYVTLIACGSVDEWGAAVVASPGVFAMSSVPPSDIEFYATIVCSGAEETPVCVDAAAKGMI